MSDRLQFRPADHAWHVVSAAVALLLLIVVAARVHLVGFDAPMVVALVLIPVLFHVCGRLAFVPLATVERDALLLRTHFGSRRVPLTEIASVDHRLARRRAKGDWFHPVITRTDGAELVLGKAAYRTDSRYQWQVQDFVEVVQRRMPVRAHQDRGVPTVH